MMRFPISPPTQVRPVSGFEDLAGGGSLWRRAGLAVAAAVACGFLGSCAPPPENYNIPASAAVARPTGVLSVGDVIRVTYPGAPEFNQTLKVQTDGRVGLPKVGTVVASGRTPSSLQASLTAMYKPHLNDPTVFVSLEQAAASVYVSGGVGKPGKVPLDRSMTALEAVMEVGGFSDLGDPRKVYVIRTERGVQQRYPINMAATLGGAQSKPFYLRPYDVVYVGTRVW